MTVTGETVFGDEIRITSSKRGLCDLVSKLYDASNYNEQQGYSIMESQAASLANQIFSQLEDVGFFDSEKKKDGLKVILEGHQGQKISIEASEYDLYDLTTILCHALKFETEDGYIYHAKISSNMVEAIRSELRESGFYDKTAEA